VILDKLHLKGFRNYIDETISFNRSTLIIGPNDSGKTNLLYALRLLFDKSISENDLDLLDSDFNAYSHANTVEITAYIKDITEDCLISTFNGNIKDNKLIIRYTWEKNGGEYSIQAGYDEEHLQDLKSRNYVRYLNMQYVDTNRDLHAFMRKERQRLLVLSKETLSEAELAEDKGRTKQIQEDLNKINEQINSLNYIDTALDNVNAQLSALSAGNEDQKVRFVAGSSDAEKMLSDVVLSYSTDDGPLTMGGDGRNNQIYLSAWLAKQHIKEAPDHVTFYAIEEPEAHLHPHQQRKLAEYLAKTLNGQVIITSHSPQIAQVYQAQNMVRLYMENKVTHAASGTADSRIHEAYKRFGYRLNAVSAEIFFSDGVFLVEGTSEVIFYNALAKALRLELDRRNISILSVEGIGFIPYVAICQALHIPWRLRTDNDIFKYKGRTEYHFAGIERALKITDECRLNYIAPDKWIHGEKNFKTKRPNVNCRKANQAVRDSIKKVGIYLSDIDLENDLAESPLSNVLKQYYSVEGYKELVEAMQKRKAENMFGFVNDKEESLKLLERDKIVEPLQSLIEEVESRVHPK